MTMLKYIELKTGYGDNGPAWVAVVEVSKSGRTIYFDGRALKRTYGQGIQGNHRDLVSGDEYWVSGIKKRGDNRHWAGAGVVLIEARAVDEYLLLTGQRTLDHAHFKVIDDLQETSPSQFHSIENVVLPR